MGTQSFTSCVVVITRLSRLVEALSSLIFCLAALCAIVPFTPAAIADAESPAKPRTEPSTQPGDTVIPLSRWGNLYLVKAATNFQKVGYLVVDTGATMSAIDSEIVNRLKLPVMGSCEINQGSGKAKVNVVRINELQVGNFSVIKAVAISTEAGKSLHLGVPVAGTLGLDFLSQQPFTLDCRHDLLILHRPESFVPPPADIAKSFALDTLANVGFAVEGKIDDRPGWFAIDSGDEEAVELYQPFMVLNRFQVPEHHYRSDGVRMLLGALLTEDRNWYSSFEIFGRKPASVWSSLLLNAPAGDDQRLFAGSVGMEEMSDGIFTFDPAHHRLWVQWPPRETTDEMVKRLGDPRGADLKGITPLMRAARAGRADVVQRLLKAGADPSAMCPADTTTPLKAAIDSEQPDVVQALLSGGAAVDQALYGHHNVTPLNYAAKAGNLQIVELLLKAGASVSATDDDGRTPLHLSIWSRHLEITKALIAAHASIEAKDNHGNTPLIYASASGKPALVEAIIAAGADIDERDGSGATALNNAADFSWTDVTRWLLEHGASVNAEGNDGVTPLISAAAYASPEVVHLLLEHGADVSHKDAKGKSAIDYAVSNGRGVIVKMLLDHLAAAAPKGDHAQNNDPVPSLEKLFAMAPDFRSEDQNIKTLQLAGHYCPNGVVQLSFELSYQRTGKGLVAIFDRSDGTPVGIWQNGKWLEYFPLERKVVLMDGGQAALFHLVGDPQKHELDFNYQFHKDPALGTGMTFDVDLKSLIDPKAATWSRQSLKGGIAELRGTSPSGSIVVAQFDPSRQWPFENVSIFPAGSKESSVAISNVVVNQKLPPEPFKFPSKAAASAQVPVLDLANDTDTVKAISKYGALEWAYRSALKRAELRPFVEQKLGRTIDWDADLKLEEKTSAAVRQLIKDAGFPTADAQKW